MSNKERLENMVALGVDGQGNVLIKGEDFHWLMELAERVQELETTVDFYQSALRDADRRVQELENHLKLYHFWYGTAYK